MLHFSASRPSVSLPQLSAELGQPVSSAAKGPASAMNSAMTALDRQTMQADTLGPLRQQMQQMQQQIDHLRQQVRDLTAVVQYKTALLSSNDLTLAEVLESWHYVLSRRFPENYLPLIVASRLSADDVALDSTVARDRARVATIGASR